MTFYDVVIEFILFDAFDDLENPPSSVTAVVQNRWLSNGFKETVSSFDLLDFSCIVVISVYVKITISYISGLIYCCVVSFKSKKKDAKGKSLQILLIITVGLW